MTERFFKSDQVYLEMELVRETSYPSYTVVLVDTFSIVLSEQSSIKCMITLHQKGILLEPRINGKTNKVRKITASDIIGCHVFHNFDEMAAKRKIGCMPAKFKSPSEVSDPSSYFCVYAYPLKPRLKGLSRTKRRERCIVTVKIDTGETKDENFETAKKWQTAILWISKGVVTRIPPSPPTSRNLLIFVNPCSGPGKALGIFREQVLPLLNESDTCHQLLVTDRMNYAREYVRDHDLTKWDGIVIVSGDGLIYEVFNGIMERPDWETAIKIPIGVIPGGSGNGLAMAISYALGEPFEDNLITAAALNLVRGRLAPMDLVKVETPTGPIYSFLSVGWGIMADIDIESERLRVIGGARFTVWALVRALGLRQYPGRLSYLPVKGHVPKPKKTAPKLTRSSTVAIESENKGGMSTYQRSLSQSLGDRRKSSIGDIAEVAFEASQVLECYDLDQENQPPTRPPRGRRKSSHNNDTLTRDMETIDLNGHSNGDTTQVNLPPLDRPVPSNWVTIEGEFVLVYVSHVSHISSDAMFAPDAKLDDGLMWLVIIQAGVTRAQVLQFLLALEDGSHVRIPFVDLVPVTAFRLEPKTKDGYLTVDGEVIDCTPIQAQVLPSIARILTR